MTVFCTQKTCDLSLDGISFIYCKDLLGQSFFNGVAIAKNVPRESLDKVDFELYCLSKEERAIDYDREPDRIVAGELALVRHGIIQRGIGPGIKYMKIGPNQVEDAFSVYEDFSLRLFGKDTKDGSNQFLFLDCKNGVCDIELADTSFSRCIENIPGDIYLGGLAKAEGVPQSSLHDFELPLYCASNFFEGIDYSEPVSLLKGGMSFLQGTGIAYRTGPGFMYVNAFKGANASALTIGSKFYQGFRSDSGGSKTLWILCNEGSCEVIIYSFLETRCVGDGRLFFNGVAFNSTVPEGSLDNFDIGLFCVPSGPGAEINYDTQQPISTIKASITSGDQRGAVRLVEDDVVYDLLQISTDY